jgi:two-component system NtrC family sensor kinase
MVSVAATHNVRAERVDRFRTQYPAPFASNPEFVTTVREGIFHLADIEHNPDATPERVEFARLAGYRTRLMAPMMRGDTVLGIIAVTREAPAPFSDEQVKLLRTFADQAVMAIENVRLFKELEARNSDLSETLEQQTATSEILRAISSSPQTSSPSLTRSSAARRRCAMPPLAASTSSMANRSPSTRIPTSQRRRLNSSGFMSFRTRPGQTACWDGQSWSDVPYRLRTCS